MGGATEGVQRRLVVGLGRLVVQARWRHMWGKREGDGSYRRGKKDKALVAGEEMAREERGEPGLSF